MSQICCAFHGAWLCTRCSFYLRDTVLSLLTTIYPLKQSSSIPSKDYSNISQVFTESQMCAKPELSWTEWTALFSVLFWNAGHASTIELAAYQTYLYIWIDHVLFAIIVQCLGVSKGLTKPFQLCLRKIWPRANCITPESAAMLCFLTCSLLMATYGQWESWSLSG